MHAGGDPRAASCGCIASGVLPRERPDPSRNLSKDDLQIIPITLTARVQKAMRLLQFQLAKFRFGRGIRKDF